MSLSYSVGLLGLLGVLSFSPALIACETTIVGLTPINGVELEIIVTGKASFNRDGWLRCRIRSSNNEILDKRIVGSVSISGFSIPSDPRESPIQKFVPAEFNKVFIAFRRPASSKSLEWLQSVDQRSRKASPFADSELRTRTITVVFHVDLYIGDKKIRRAIESELEVALPSRVAVESLIAGIPRLTKEKGISTQDLEGLRTLVACPDFFSWHSPEEWAKLLDVLISHEVGDDVRVSITGASSSLSPEIKEVYLGYLHSDPFSVIHDIENSRSLWHRDFAPPIFQAFHSTKNYSFRLRLLRAIRAHQSFTFATGRPIISQLRERGELDLAPAEVSKEFFTVIELLQDPSAVYDLEQYLDVETLYSSGIPLSAQAGYGLPQIRICDCAHDTIVALCGASLDARIGSAYEKLGITNRFDLRSISRVLQREAKAKARVEAEATNNRKDATEEIEEIVDPSEDQRVYDEVRLVRDAMISQLEKDLRESREP